MLWNLSFRISLPICTSLENFPLVWSLHGKLATSLQYLHFFSDHCNSSLVNNIWLCDKKSNILSETLQIVQKPSDLVTRIPSPCWPLITKEIQIQPNKIKYYVWTVVLALVRTVGPTGQMWRHYPLLVRNFWPAVSSKTQLLSLVVSEKRFRKENLEEIVLKQRALFQYLSLLRDRRNTVCWFISVSEYQRLVVCKFLWNYTLLSLWCKFSNIYYLKHYL